MVYTKKPPTIRSGGVLSVKKNYLIGSSALALGNGTSTFTRGAVIPKPFLERLISRTASLFAAPPRVKLGNLAVVEHPVAAIKSNPTVSTTVVFMVTKNRLLDYHYVGSLLLFFQRNLS
jgi:hypothetical protein